MSTVDRTILVVDDAEDCVATLDLALAVLPGVAVVSASSAEGALEMLEGVEITAIVTDIQLPTMTGIELIAHIRRQSRYRTVPIVVVSATPDPAARGDALEAGANAFFAKPFSPSAVRKKLEQLLEESIHAN